MIYLSNEEGRSENGVEVVQDKLEQFITTRQASSHVHSVSDSRAGR